MATSKTPDHSVKRKRPPATTPEARENQLVAQAFDYAEKQMNDGTAPAAIVMHFVKLGSRSEILDQEKKKAEITLLKAKQEAYESGKRIEELYGEAIKSFRVYSGQDEEVPDDR